MLFCKEPLRPFNTSIEFFDIVPLFRDIMRSKRFKCHSRRASGLPLCQAMKSIKTPDFWKCAFLFIERKPIILTVPSHSVFQQVVMVCRLVPFSKDNGAEDTHGKGIAEHLLGQQVSLFLAKRSPQNKELYGNSCRKSRRFVRLSQVIDWDVEGQNTMLKTSLWIHTWSGWFTLQDLILDDFVRCFDSVSSFWISYWRNPKE